MDFDSRAKSCTYNGISYSDGSQKCINGVWNICDDGSWENAGLGTCFVNENICCNNIGFPPINPPSAPTNPSTPTPGEVARCKNKWVYIWISPECENINPFWMFVKSVFSDECNYWYVSGCVRWHDGTRWQTRYTAVALQCISNIICRQ